MRIGWLLLVACAACTDEVAPEESGAASTASVPAPRVVGLAELETRLAEARGAPLLVNFWATWCAPCVAELPELIEVVAEFDDRGLQLVTVSYDSMVPGVADGEAALQLVRDHLTSSGLSFEVLVYDEDDYDGINERLGLPGPIPVTLAFDAEGREVARTEESTDAEGFRSLARAALGAE